MTLGSIAADAATTAMLPPYLKCELIDGWSPRYINMLTNLFVVVVNYIHQYKLCIVDIVD